MSRELRFGFRPWVRSTCRKAMLWGIGALAVVGAVAWWLRSPDSGIFGWPFAVLAGYMLLFLVSLLKIWWTAGGAAVVLDERGLGYQPLHTFRPRRVPWERILATGPRPGTQSYRIVVEGRRSDKELFLNLAVVRDRHTLVEALGERLEALGLRRAGEGWERPAAPPPGG